jgi:hypothetical protein
MTCFAIISKQSHTFQTLEVLLAAPAAHCDIVSVQGHWASVRCTLSACSSAGITFESANRDSYSTNTFGSDGVMNVRYFQPVYAVWVELQEYRLIHTELTA